MRQVGYYFYGGCAADVLTLNLIHSNPLLGVIATVCVLANVFFTFPSFCAPVVRILTEVTHSAYAGEPTCILLSLLSRALACL